MKATNRVFGVTQHYIRALLVKPEDEVMNAPDTPLTNPAHVRQLFRDAYKVARDERKARR